MTMKDQLTALIEQYKQLGIDSQIDYEKSSTRGLPQRENRSWNKC